MVGIQHISDDIIHVSYPDRILLTTTFLRFQEYYESQEFKGKIFSLEVYAAWYAKENGIFDYYTESTAFNLPSTVFDPFYEGRFDPLSDKEEFVLDMLRNEEHPYYVIATFGSGIADLEHELAHALFFTNPEYRQKAQEIVAGLPPEGREKMNAYLKKRTYHPDVWEDETQAFLLDLSFLRDTRNIDTSKMEEASRMMKILFSEYSP